MTTTHDEQTELAKQAHKRGEPVECKDATQEAGWLYTGSPIWNPNCHYRPEPPERTKARLESWEWLATSALQGVNLETLQPDKPDPYAEVKEQLLSAVYDSRDRHRAEMETEAHTMTHDEQTELAKQADARGEPVEFKLKFDSDDRWGFIEKPTWQWEWVHFNLADCRPEPPERTAARLAKEKPDPATVKDSLTVPRASILDDAKRIVCEDRNQKFGEPEDLFTEIAGHWSLHLGHPVTAKDVATMMLLLKATRCKRAPDDRDSWVDAAGYAACGGGI